MRLRAALAVLLWDGNEAAQVTPGRIGHPPAALRAGRSARETASRVGENGLHRTELLPWVSRLWEQIASANGRTDVEIASRATAASSCATESKRPILVTRTTKLQGGSGCTQLAHYLASLRFVGGFGEV